MQGLLRGLLNKAAVLPGGEILPSETLPIITKPLSLTNKLERQQEAILRKREEKRLNKEALRTKVRTICVARKVFPKNWKKTTNLTVRVYKAYYQLGCHTIYQVNKSKLLLNLRKMSK